MKSDFFGAVLAFLVGCAIAYINFLFSKYILKKHPQKYALSTVARQVLTVAFLVAIFLFADKTPWNLTYLLIGGVLGATVPMLLFTSLLLKVNREISNQAEQGEKEDG